MSYLRVSLVFTLYVLFPSTVILQVLSFRKCCFWNVRQSKTQIIKWWIFLLENGCLAEIVNCYIHIVSFCVTKGCSLMCFFVLFWLENSLLSNSTKLYILVTHWISFFCNVCFYFKWLEMYWIVRWYFWTGWLERERFLCVYYYMLKLSIHKKILLYSVNILLCFCHFILEILQPKT